MISPLSELLFPISLKDFRASIEENRHHHFKDVYGSIRSFDFVHELNELCGRHDISYPIARIVHEGSAIPLESYYSSDGKHLNVPKAFDLFAQGHTIVVQPSYGNLPKINAYASDLTQELGCTVDLSFFITPARSVGLRAHFDTSSAFIFQIRGCKKWTLYAPYAELPLAHNIFRFDSYVNTPVLAEIVLREGERLYLPRGVVHEPASQNEVSIHMTISLELPTFAEAVEQSILQTQGIKEPASTTSLGKIRKQFLEN